MSNFVVSIVSADGLYIHKTGTITDLKIIVPPTFTE